MCMPARLPGLPNPTNPLYRTAPVIPVIGNQRERRTANYLAVQPPSINRASGKDTFFVCGHITTNRNPPITLPVVSHFLLDASILFRALAIVSLPARLVPVLLDERHHGFDSRYGLVSRGARYSRRAPVCFLIRTGIYSDRAECEIRSERQNSLEYHLGKQGSVGANAQLFLLWLCRLDFLQLVFFYLAKERGLDLKSSAFYSTLPFLAMATCSPLGGAISDKVTKKYGKRIGRCGIVIFALLLAAFFLSFGSQVQSALLASVVLAGGAGALYLSQALSGRLPPISLLDLQVPFRVL